MVSTFSGEPKGRQLFSGVSEIWEARYRILSIGKLTPGTNTTTTTYAAEFRDQVTVHDIMGTIQAKKLVSDKLEQIKTAIEVFDRTGSLDSFGNVGESIFVSSVPSDAQCTYLHNSITSMADLVRLFRSQFYI
jgi:hypothetical protein